MLPKNRRPAHPGKILYEHFLNPLDITQARFVEHLGGTWTASKLNNIIHEKRGITPAIALDFADALNTSPEFWMNLQFMYDLWNTVQNHQPISPMDEALAS